MDEELGNRMRTYLEGCEEEFAKELKDYESKCSEFEITLHDGRLIKLDQFHQKKMYSGVILGHSRPGAFENHIESVEEFYGKYITGGRSKFHVVKPRLIVKDLYQEWMPQEAKRGLKSRSRELVPPIICIASFYSLKARDGSDESCSQLSVIWWQHHWGVPNTNEALLGLKNIAWSELAMDYLD